MSNDAEADYLWHLVAGLCHRHHVHSSQGGSVERSITHSEVEGLFQSIEHFPASAIPRGSGFTLGIDLSRDAKVSCSSLAMVSGHPSASESRMRQPLTALGKGGRIAGDVSARGARPFWNEVREGSELLAHFRPALLGRGGHLGTRFGRNDAGFPAGLGFCGSLGSSFSSRRRSFVALGFRPPGALGGGDACAGFRRHRAPARFRRFRSRSFGRRGSWRGRGTPENGNQFGLELLNLFGDEDGAFELIDGRCGSWHRSL